jgi:hypothetical protein
MRFRLFVLLVLGLLPIGMRAQFLYWDYHNITDDIALSGQYPDMVIDATGSIHACYWHEAEDRLIYAFKSAGGSTWTREYVDATQANGFRSAITVDASNTPHIIYQENNVFTAEVRYAKRSPSGVWTIENIPSGPNGYGEYGPNTVNNSSQRIKHSLDILIDENQRPQVIFFDGWMAPNAFPICNASSQYGFKLHQAVRGNGGIWTVRNFGVVPDTWLSCGATAPLPLGDRYGEYCNLVQRLDGTMDAFCLGRFNGQVMNFHNTVPNQDTVWSRVAFDSLTRHMLVDSGGMDFSHEYFSWEGISSVVDPDDNIHLAYTGSVLYGENFCCIDTLNGMYYARVEADTIVYRFFGKGVYRNHTSIATQGTDSVYFTYADVSRGLIILQQSHDAGLTWSADTLLDAPASSAALIKVLGDSLQVMFYNPEKDRLSRFSRHLAGGPWQEDRINNTDFSGHAIDGYLHAGAGDTTVSGFYSDRYSGALTFARGGSAGGFNFSTSVLAGASGAQLVAADRRANGDAVVVYTGDPGQSLQLAYGQPGAWNYAVIDTQAQVQSLDMQISSQDSVHIAFRLATSNCLYHLHGHISAGSWDIDTVQCDSLPVGEYVSLQLDASQRPHIAYSRSVGRSVMYARTQGSGWLIDSVNGGTASVMGKYASLRLDAAGLPKIAYLDEQATSVLLSEKIASGSWVHTEVDSVPVTNLGRPIELELDGFGKVWVAYNAYGNFDKVKLMHRDSIWREVAVSTAGQIANAFFFRILGGGLYLTGRKNALQNTGVALLRARNGVFVQAEPPLPLRENVQLGLAPNPFSGTTTFHLDIRQGGSFSLEVVDLCGRPVARLLDDRRLGPGKHTVDWNAADQASGIYLYRLSGPGGTASGKMVVNR